MSHKSRNILLTGGTGFVGKALLALLAEDPAYDQIYLLVRPRRGQSPAQRVAGILKTMFAPERLANLSERIRGVEGDLTQEQMGLSEADLMALAPKVHQLVHIGASTDFGAPIEESRLHNVEGTRHAISVALRWHQKGVLERFEYVSTAYVSGCKPGLVTEADLDRQQDFSNNYERSKFEAETLVQQYQASLPITIYRPSIVVGDSQTGYTPHFKVLYWPLQILAKNLVPFFPCNTRARLDVVPVDYVARGMQALMKDSRSVGQTFLLTAGHGHEVRIKELLKDAYKIAGIKRRPILPFWLFFGVRSSPLARLFDAYFWQAVDLALPYYRYLRGNRVYFDARMTEQRLAEWGVSCPRWTTYKVPVLRFCLESRWGRKLPRPEHSYYQQSAVLAASALSATH